MSIRDSLEVGDRTRAAVALVYRLAALMRAGFIYPAHNARVVEARDEFVKHAGLWTSSGNSVAITLSGDSACIDGEAVQVPKQLQQWLAECFGKARIGGVEVTAAIDAEAATEFADVLQEAEVDTESGHEQLWSGEFTGLRPLPPGDAPDGGAGGDGFAGERGAELRAFRIEEGPVAGEHRETDLPSASLDEFSAELERLPLDGELGLQAPADEDSDATLGILLRRYTMEDNDRAAERIGKRVAPMLAQPTEAQRQVVLSYLQTEGENESTPQRSVITLICSLGHPELLQGQEFLRPDVVAFNFPRQFGLFLSTLSPKRKEDLQRLRDACFAIDAKRVQGAIEELTGDQGILTPERVEVLAATGTFEARALLLVALEHGPSWVRPKVAQYLRRLDLPEGETSALRALDESQIPAGYLIDLCRMESAFGGDQKLRQYSELLLREFLEKNPDISNREQRRVYAIQALRLHPSMETIRLLKRLASPARMLGKHSRAERQAARTALQHMTG